MSLIGISLVFHFLNSDYDRALEFSKRGKVLAEKSNNKWIIGYSFVNMALIYFSKGDFDRALSLSEHGIKVFSELKNEFMVALQLNNMGFYYARRGELDRALKATERGLRIAKESGINWLIAGSFLNMAVAYLHKGDVDRCIKLNKEALSIFKELNIKRWHAFVLNLMGEAYRQRGELDHALEYQEQCLALYKNSGNLKRIMFLSDNLIQILIEKGDIERVQELLNHYEQLIVQLNDKFTNLIYLLNKALLLKISSRARNRAKAEEILTQILDEKEADYELTIRALSNLCDLHLTELQMTNDLEVLEEINPLITRLLDIVEKSGSFSVLCETYLLQAKLSLITFDITKSQQFLTQAQQIAEKFGLKLLAMKISNEHDELLKQVNMWQNLQKSGSSFKERIKFARLNEQMENMIRKRVVEVPELLNEDPVLLLIVSEGGIPIFSQLFVKDPSFEDHLFGGFFTAINSFIREKFSEGLDRATFGEHTLLLNSVSPFMVCYVFKGQSYAAQQRVGFFIEKIQEDEDIWQSFEKFYQMNQEIQIKDIPSLEPLITNIFIDKNLPLIA
jgi:tetratricopeptide (TPR) repeat protein